MHSTGALQHSLSAVCIHLPAPGFQAVAFQHFLFPASGSLLVPLCASRGAPAALRAQLLLQGRPGSQGSTSSCSLSPKYRASLSTPISEAFVPLHPSASAPDASLTAPLNTHSTAAIFRSHEENKPLGCGQPINPAPFTKSPFFYLE